MQKFVTKIAVFTAIIMALSFSANAQIYVKIRPKAPVMERPAPPRKNQVWVGEEWTVRNGKYEYSGGRWVAPRRGYTWVAGHWQRHGRDGERWVAGYWRKNRR